LVPCFAANVVGTTGAGDCTIAGFLAGFLDDLTPERVMTAAVGVGAFSVERADSVSGVPSWAEVQTRIQAGWSQQSVSLSLPTWRWDARRRLYLGPNERQ
jgi:sugar/nucleoside kinase (ribokinase family)